MTANNDKKASVEQKRVRDGKQELVKNWLTRRLWRPQGQSDEEVYARREVSPRRPQTAPTGHTGRPMASPATIEPPLVRPRNKPPSRPPRPDSTIIQDVSAWLDASMIRPAPTLMAGIPYWREGNFTGSSVSTDVRYATPIVQNLAAEDPSTFHSQHIKSFCRRAKKMQVRMPTLLRTRSQRATVVQQKKLNRRSRSMPLLSLSDEIHATTAPSGIFQSRSLLDMDITPHITVRTISPRNDTWPEVEQRWIINQPRRLGSLVTVRVDGQEPYTEQRLNVSRQSTSYSDSARVSTTTNRLTREDSLGNLSDAPTYFSGPPPPSYRSRAASIVTTSSFGCIDSMSIERRQFNQHRTMQRDHGIRGRFKMLAQRARLTK